MSDDLTLEDIPAAMRLLISLPREHAADRHNCGECWACVFTTLSVADIVKRENRA